MLLRLFVAWMFLFLCGYCEETASLHRKLHGSNAKSSKQRLFESHNSRHDGLPQNVLNKKNKFSNHHQHKFLSNDQIIANNNDSNVSSGGEIWYVNSKSGNSGTGKSWNSAFKTVQDAIDACGNGDQIWIAEGTYTPTSDSSDISATYKLTQDGIKVYGGFLGIETSVDQRESPLPTTTLSGNIGGGNYATHVVMLQGNHIYLDGLTISDGYALGDSDGDNYCLDCFGGGIYILNPETTAAGGSSVGGIPSTKSYYYYSMSQVTMSNNKAIQGGAIFSYCYIDLTIDDCTFSNNQAFDGTNHAGGGGAIFATYHSILTITNSQFTSNEASTAGGAINIDYGITASITESEFISNIVSDGHGGAIYVTDRNSNSGDTTLTTTACNYIDNYASGWGGAIFMYYDSVGNMVGNTFASNSAGLAGGALGLYNVDCLGCCDDFGSNTFSGNTGSSSNPSQATCYIDEFEYIGRASTNTNASPYLLTLYYQRGSEPSQYANQVFVDGSKSVSGDGSSWSTAVKTLQEGIDAAALKGPGKTEVWVRGGSSITYYPTEVPSWYNKTMEYYNPEKSKMISLKTNVHVYGGFGGFETSRSQRNWYTYPTTISGQLSFDIQVYQVVYMASNSYIDGFIIRNGHSYEGGELVLNNKTYFGKMDNTTHKPIFYDVPKTTPQGSQNQSQGGLGRNSNRNNVLTSPVPNRGSGIFANVTCSMANLVVTDNYAWKGGGLYVLDHSVTATNIALVNNYGEYRGGGVGVDSGGTYRCTDCIYDGNGCSRKGGGMYLDYACTSYNTNAYWVNNDALDSGGALCIDGAGKSYVYSNIVKNNSAFMEGAALYAGSYNPYTARPNIWVLSDTLIEDNKCTTGMGHANSFLWNYDYIQSS